MKHCHALYVALSLLLLGAPLASAQSVAAWSVGSSAGVVSGSNGTVALSAGQPISGQSGNLYAGFWGIAGGIGPTSSLDDVVPLPYKWEIGNAYPNPFNPSTTVMVSLAAAAPVHAEVYNVLGRRVAVLADGVRPAGVHRLQWRANGVASGVYFLRTVVPGRMQKMQRVVLVK